MSCTLSRSSGPLVFLGATGVKSFTDETIPAGATPCTYQITAIRSTGRGEPARVVVNFGSSGGDAELGLAGESVKMAAA